MSLPYLPTKEIIANRALIAIGSEGIVSFEDGTPQANVVKQIYSSYIQSLLTRGNWSFSSKQMQLTQLVETPVAFWRYSYEFPANCLKIRSLYSSNQPYVIPTQDYQIFEPRVIYSNEQQLWADYINVVDESQWPYYFVEFVIDALSYKFSYPITRDVQLTEYCRGVAFGSAAENWEGGTYAEACNQDSKQNTNCFLPLSIQQNSRNYMGANTFGTY